jgi:hypothetical protein
MSEKEQEIKNNIDVLMNHKTKEIKQNKCLVWDWARRIVR